MAGVVTKNKAETRTGRGRIWNFERRGLGSETSGLLHRASVFGPSSYKDRRPDRPRAGLLASALAASRYGRRHSSQSQRLYSGVGIVSWCYRSSPPQIPGPACPEVSLELGRGAGIIRYTAGFI